MLLRTVRNLVQSPVLIARLALCLICSITLAQVASAQQKTATPGALVVSGEGFSLRAFRSGALACSNRTYVWEGVPDGMDDWQFTQVAGGERAVVSVFASQDSVVTIATAEKGVALPEWQLVKEAAFSYSDQKHTALDLYARTLSAGETASIPQFGWSGTLVLAPVLQFRPQTPPPGTLVTNSPKPATIYVGSPSLVVLPNGDYLAALDLFGPGSSHNRPQIFRSPDKGRTWHPQSEILGGFWGSLFLHRGALYFLGQNREDGSIAIRRSTDEGQHWTTPKDEKSGLLTPDKGFSGAPTPVVEHDGRLWRAMEVRPAGRKGRYYSAFMMSAPVGADLLDATSWTYSNLVEFPQGGPGDSWLEGNAVVAPSGQMVNILRVERNGGETAAVMRISPDGTRATFDAERDFIAFPGGSVKFTIRFDAKSRRYWSLVNAQRNPDARRNRLALVSSPDLRNWRVEQDMLSDPEHTRAFQYADWQFEGDDLIFLSRTAWDGSRSFHDSNYITFHRITKFREANLRALN